VYLCRGTLPIHARLRRQLRRDIDLGISCASLISPTIANLERKFANMADIQLVHDGFVDRSLIVLSEQRLGPTLPRQVWLRELNRSSASPVQLSSTGSHRRLSREETVSVNSDHVIVCGMESIPLACSFRGRADSVCCSFSVDHRAVVGHSRILISPSASVWVGDVSRQEGVSHQSQPQSTTLDSSEAEKTLSIYQNQAEEWSSASIYTTSTTHRLHNAFGPSEAYEL
jgi:hypothetical protein